SRGRSPPAAVTRSAPSPSMPMERWWTLRRGSSRRTCEQLSPRSHRPATDMCSFSSSATTAPIPECARSSSFRNRSAYRDLALVDLFEQLLEPLPDLVDL